MYHVQKLVTYVIIAVENQVEDILVVIGQDGAVESVHMICVLNVIHVPLFHHLRPFLRPRLFW